MDVRKFWTKLNLNYQKILIAFIKVGLGSLFFIIAFNLSHTAFFQENPIWGVKYMAEIVLGLAAAAFGFHTLPIIMLKIKEWIEKFIAEQVAKIVADFWEQQTRRMQESRRKKQKEKKEEREKKLKEKFEDGVLLDTSVLIDGRILGIVKAGFLENILIVPQSVVDEMHLIADSGADLKRQRGRRGLDVVNELKKSTKVVIFKLANHANGENGVDKELVRLGKRFKLKLMTLDFNLNKVAAAADLKVLNVNELANSVKVVVLPGESLRVKIVQKGKEEGQGVGYFDDGTMIVVDGASDKVGREIEVTVSRVIQTSAGKMVFCSLG